MMIVVLLAGALPFLPCGCSSAGPKVATTPRAKLVQEGAIPRDVVDALNLPPERTARQAMGTLAYKLAFDAELDMYSFPGPSNNPSAAPVVGREQLARLQEEYPNGTVYPVLVIYHANPALSACSFSYLALAVATGDAGPHGQRIDVIRSKQNQGSYMPPVTDGPASE